MKRLKHKGSHTKGQAKFEARQYVTCSASGAVYESTLPTEERPCPNPECVRVWDARVVPEHWLEKPRAD